MEPTRLLYKFSFEGGHNNSYIFRTDPGISYQIKFKPSGYLVPDEPFAEHVFELVLEITENPGGGSIRYDPLVSATVACIVLDFYNKSKKTITIYMCDSSDRRQEARRRKFDQWFCYFAQNDFAKVEFYMAEEGETVTYRLSVMISLDNPDKLRIFSAFEQLARGVGK